MKLPHPDHAGSLPVEAVIKRRRTVRSFSSQPISQNDLSQLVYAAQGITDGPGFKRAAPSAGALYPLDIYAVVGEKGVEDMGAGVYHYTPSQHRIARVTARDLREPLAKASLHQMWMADSPLCVVITAQYSRNCGKYGDRGVRYAMIEAGHVGQNIFLQAEALGLKAGIVGAFKDTQVIKVLGIPKQHEPLLIMPVGHQRS
jgi:SagB-type dehydrogenase family enzyme